MAPLTWVLVAFVSAVVVLGIGMLTATSTAGAFFADLRAWFRREPGATGVRPAPEARYGLPEVNDQAESVEALFEIGERPKEAYVDPVAVVRPLADLTRPVMVGRPRSSEPEYYPGRRRPVAPDRLLR